MNVLVPPSILHSSQNNLISKIICTKTLHTEWSAHTRGNQFFGSFN